MGPFGEERCAFSLNSLKPEGEKSGYRGMRLSEASNPCKRFYTSRWRLRDSRRLGSIFGRTSPNITFPSSSKALLIITVRFRRIAEEKKNTSVMASTKRKIPDLGLQRRVRPRVEPEPESDVDDSSSEVPSEEGVDSAGSEDEGGDSASEVSEDESEPVRP